MSMSQAALAERAGVSRKWVYEFEAGKPTAELALVLKVLDALDIELNLVEREPLGEEPELTDTELALTKALERSAAPRWLRREQTQGQMTRGQGKSAERRRTESDE